MSVSTLYDWRRPGCGDRCMPRQHDPDDHEQYGRELAAWDAQPRIVETGPLTVDIRERRVWVDGIEIALPAKFRTQWTVLECLAKTPGRVVSMELISRKALDLPLTTGSRHALQAATCRLRQRLGSAGRLITTVGGRGLRLELEPAS